DLVETVFDLRVVNSATRNKASSPGDAEVSELGSDGLALRVPRALCSSGHLLSIELTFRRKHEKQPVSKLVLTGKVLGISPIDEISSLASIRLYQFEAPVWEEFREKHGRRQTRVSDAIRARQS